MGTIINNPIKVAVGVLLVALFGTVSLIQMPLQLTPEVQRPTISIETKWPGASPQEVEREIIIEQEEQLKGVQGVWKLSSESSDSVGKITLEFEIGTSLEKTVVDVISRLEQVPEYPEDADKPVISTANANDRPIAWFILSSKLRPMEEIIAFQQEHPELKDELQEVIDSFNPGLAKLRLRNLADKHPEVAVLLPPPEINVSKMRRFAEDEIEARFERVVGVSQSNVIGGLEDELRVIVDPGKLAARQLTIPDVRNVLRGQNKDTSGGDYWEGKRRYVVRTLGQYRDPKDVEEQLLSMQNGQPVYVRDVAEVELGYKKPDSLVMRYGESTLAINALRETGANVVDVMDGLREVADKLNEGILAERGLELSHVYDETLYINSSVDLVRQNIFVGGAFTILVLMCFLHFGYRTVVVIPIVVITAVASAYVSPWIFSITLLVLIGTGLWYARGAFIVGMAIPISIIGTFLILGLLGRSLNVISLAGMAFAVGMLVDNAVVVLENIYRRYEKGDSPFNAAVNGSKEVWGAVLSSTLTTIAVFLPIVFVEQEAGQLFRDIALAISGAVGLSLVVSMTLIPVTSARLLSEHGPQKTAGKEKQKAAYVPVEWLASKGAQGIVSTNRFIQSSMLIQLCVVCLIVGLAGGASYLFWPKVEYLPTGNRNLVIGLLLPPPGYNYDKLKAMGETVEAELRPYWDVDPESEAAKKLDFPVIGDFFFVVRQNSVFLGLRAHDAAQVGKLVPLVPEVGKQLSGTFAIAFQSSLFDQGLTAGRSIDVEITGPDLEILTRTGGQIMGMLRGSRETPGLLPPDTQMRPVPSLDLASPEFHIKPKLIQMAEMGMTNVDLGYAVNALIDGAYAGDYYLDNDKIDLSIVGADEYSIKSQDVSALPISTPIGQLVPLEALAKTEITSGPQQINHRERERAITIQIAPPPNLPLETAMSIVENDVAEKIRTSGQLGNEYRINLAGTADKLRQTWQALRFNVLLALLITYLLMAALFESWVYPFVIILSVPLGAVGGVIGLQLLNLFVLQPLDVLTMLGFVILIGTVVNNPILIVHQSLVNINEEGMAPQPAILDAVESRIRPIFMTTATTVLGLLPLVIFPGAGSELYRGLGSVVLGGLVVSSIFTLLLVPTLFRLVLDTNQMIGSVARRLSNGNTKMVASKTPDTSISP